MVTMDAKQVKNIVAYWEETAQQNYETMRALFQTKRYSDCLFFGHLLLEKILKALVVQTTKQQSPFIHDLVRLQELASVLLTDAEIALLNKVNDFNIRTRYPDYKLRFYKQCTKKYTEDNLEQITELYKKLCQKLK